MELRRIHFRLGGTKNTILSRFGKNRSFVFMYIERGYTDGSWIGFASLSHESAVQFWSWAGMGCARLAFPRGAREGIIPVDYEFRGPMRFTDASNTNPIHVNQRQRTERDQSP